MWLDDPKFESFKVKNLNHEYKESGYKFSHCYFQFNSTM